MTNETTAARFRYLGVTDESTTCEKCGKPQLKSTVMIVPLDVDGNDDGEPLYYGSTCAARALGVRGGGRAVLQSARWAHQRTLAEANDSRHVLANYELPEVGPATGDQLHYARLIFQSNHRNASWFDETTLEGWSTKVGEMHARRQAKIADARRLGIPNF